MRFTAPRPQAEATVNRVLTDAENVTSLYRGAWRRVH